VNGFNGEPVIRTVKMVNRLEHEHVTTLLRYTEVRIAWTKKKIAEKSGNVTLSFLVQSRGVSGNGESGPIVPRRVERAFRNGHVFVISLLRSIMVRCAMDHHMKYKNVKSKLVKIHQQ